MQLRAVVGDRPSRMPSHCRVTAQEVLPHEGAGAGLSPAGTAAAAEQSGLAAAPIEIGSGVSADTAWQAAGQRQQAREMGRARLCWYSTAGTVLLIGQARLCWYPLYDVHGCIVCELMQSMVTRVMLA